MTSISQTKLLKLLQQKTQERDDQSVAYINGIDIQILKEEALNNSIYRIRVQLEDQFFDIEAHEGGFSYNSQGKCYASFTLPGLLT